MEGDTEESDEDIQEEGKSTVLWEKCIQQSIFVDLSEDESIHLSDLENSLAFHLSQAESAPSEASIHLSGSAELSELEDISSESSTVSSKSVNAVGSKSKSSIFHVSVQRPNTMQHEPPAMQECEDSGQNTSDEDQEDLPYDGDLGSPYFNQTGSSTGNSDGGHTVHGSPDIPGFPELLQEDAVAKKDHSLKVSNSTEVAPPCLNSAHINHLLLRHFSREDLLQSGRLIEAETLPEVSLLESLDDTILSFAPAHNSIVIHSNHTEGSNERSYSASKNESLEIKTEKKTGHFTLTGADNNGSSSANSSQSHRDASSDEAEQEKAGDEDDQVHRVPLVRTRSFSEMKYGQGQVHYPLPDFSKVAPKVKIPKAPSGPIRYIPQCPSTMHRAQSSPGMLEVISRVLDDSVQPLEKPYVFKDDDKQTSPALVHHLQAEYDKLLTKYAEAENLIDQMRLGTNTQLSSEQKLYSENDDGEHVECDIRSPLRHLTPPPFPSENLSENKEETIHHRTVKEMITVSSNQHQDCPSDGERMTAELRDIISQFMQKVEEFKFSVSNMDVSTVEQQMMLRSMMEAQDQLERNYISKKEEHRALEMQNYMGLSRNTGAFDPNRLVEGDIFRIGMHLEDIKEVIDKNIYEQISPPHSSSTPTSTAASQHAKPGPLCIFTPSPPSSSYEGTSAGFSTVSYQMNAKDEEINHIEEATEVHGDGGSNQSSELTTAEPLMENAGSITGLTRDLLGSAEGPDIQTAEDKKGCKEEKSLVLSEVTDHSDILAYLSGTTGILTQTQLTGSSGDLGDCVSLAVETSSSDAPRHSDSHSPSEPPLNTSCMSQEQRIVSPETDSGFGSSYLNQSTSETFQPNLLTRSVGSQNEGISSSDSEGSCSNLQTAILSAAPCDHQRTSSHPSIQTQHCKAAAAVELWLESTTKEASVMLQGGVQNPPVQLHHHVSDPVLSHAMDTVDGRSPLHSCSCNSDAILALQSEVSRLKKELENGLVQLPHLAQKMDYLTSKYRQERHGRRSKSRSHQTPDISSVKKSSGRGRSNLSSSQLRLEDWISSDMDPSKSKGTDSDDGSCSEVMIHDSVVGSRRGRGTKCLMGEHKDKLQLATQSNRGRLDINSTLKREIGLASESHIKHRPQDPSLQKPLLQVSYGSSSSLPASYKVREPQLQPMSHPRKRSTQSDTALLPSNVYFQRTLSPVSVSSRTASKAGRRRGKKEEDMNRTLDWAIEVALTMKRTTDCMAQRLSADLAKAQLHRKLNNMQPLEGSKHQPL